MYLQNIENYINDIIISLDNKNINKMKQKK